MGFESFRVELRGGKATYKEVVEAARQLPHIKPDLHSVALPGTLYFLHDDGLHVIELALSDSPVCLSCRFTLCHPASVVAGFLDLVRELMTRLRMQVTICDDVRPEHEHSFLLSEFGEFSAAASGYVAARRAEWIAMFGDEPLAATTPEVYQRIILPRCQPGIEQPT